MSTTTTNYNLIKPALTDAPPDITAMNPNWDTIDAILKELYNKCGSIDGVIPVEKGGTGATTIEAAKEALGLFPNKLFPSESADPTNTVYLSPNGDDVNDGSEQFPMKTLRGAISKFGGCAYLKLYLGAGEYTDNSDEGVLTVSGCSFVSIFNGATNVEDVVIKVPLYFRGVPFYLENITVDVSASNGAYCVTGRSASFGISGCNFKGAIDTTNGVMARYGAVGLISGSTISNCKIAVRADTSGTIFATTLSSTSNNTVGYSVVNGIIGLTANNLTSTTTYSKSGSGVIFVEGVAYGDVASHNQSASTITAGTFAATGVKAATGTDYTTYRVRNAAIVSATPSSMTNGEIAFVYS